MCAASVRCYAAALKAGTLLIDLDEKRLPLRHSHHRYRVDGPNGVQTLTVPLVGSTNNMMTPLRDVLISEHGPYFDYVADDLQRVIYGSQRYLHEFNSQLHEVIIDFMDLPIKTALLLDVETDRLEVTDLRGRIAMKKPDTLPIANVPYYQMWKKGADGFRPDLSILDLMMNMGREGIFTLQEMVE